MRTDSFIYFACASELRNIAKSFIHLTCRRSLFVLLSISLIFVQNRTMEFNLPEETSKFQKFNGMVLKFLEKQRNTDENKLIYRHQIDAVFAVKEYFSSAETPDRPALVVAPTGAGKSGIVALLPYVLAASKVMILSPSLIITKQLEMEFGLRNDAATESFYFKRGMIQESHLNAFLEAGKKIDHTEAIKNMQKYNLVIVNAQKFSKNSSASLVEPDDTVDEMVGIQLLRTRENFASFTTLIVDEAHHYPAETWDLIYREFRGKQIVFLTATPFRGCDRKELWDGQRITYNISKQALIEMKIIRSLRYANINCGNMGGNTRSQLIEEFINQTLDEHDQLEPSVQHKAMVLVQDKEQAEKEATSFQNATYFTSDKRTGRNLKQFENSTRRILFVCGSLLEGYDNPDVSLCVILRKVGVLGLFTQFVGRCIRVSKNLPNNRTDPVEAVVASVYEFAQETNFNDYRDY
ncbi:51.5 kDa protein [Pseudolycoriella hygida]|uniref:51.5 kDa protein n=1 Tax=Pseudolycoriella hygida TaxID=35572 RepID=A0A9Q0MSR4_9DIPT|nr:51.5 kDa protein [Pseudolycoriella hygida]